MKAEKEVYMKITCAKDYSAVIDTLSKLSATWVTGAPLSFVPRDIKDITYLRVVFSDMTSKNSASASLFYGTLIIKKGQRYLHNIPIRKVTPKFLSDLVLGQNNNELHGCLIGYKAVELRLKSTPINYCEDRCSIDFRAIMPLIAKIEIPEGTPRHMTLSKCRAAKAKILGYYQIINHNIVLLESPYRVQKLALEPYKANLDYEWLSDNANVVSMHDHSFVYPEVGQEIIPDEFDESDVICSSGIHFFRTPKEVMTYIRGRW